MSQQTAIQSRLLDVPKSAPSLRQRITAFKKLHGILTFKTSRMKREEYPWIAVLPVEEDKGKDIGTIMAESCRLYDESGYLAEGTGELSAIRTLCQQLEIKCDL